MVKKWTKKQRVAFKECLALWGKLSEMPDRRIHQGNGVFKDSVLVKLKIGKRTCGCPFCSRFIRTESCPLGDCTYGRPCYSTPYENWVNRASGRLSKHNRLLAKAFYLYLKQLYKKGGN